MVNGVKYTQSQQLKFIEKTKLGCDSITLYDIQIVSPILTFDKVIGCDSVIYNSKTFFINTTKIDSFISTQGCDSLHTQTVIVNKSYHSEIKKILCKNEKYTLPDGRVVDTSGVFITKFFTKNGCDSTISTTINYAPPNYIPYGSVSKCLGDSLVIDLSNWNYFTKFRWNDGTEGSNFIVTNFGRYIVTMTDMNGCQIKDTIVVRNANCKPCPLYIPNAFTLNKDGLNDNFHPIFPIPECEFIEYKFEVFNRWGEKLFQTTNPYATWDGVYMGKEVADGVYMYILYYVEKKSLNRALKKGTVTLLK